MNYNPQCESDYDSSDDNMVASVARNAIQIEPKNTILQIGNTQVGLLIDSGSVCSILPQSLAAETVENSPLARWLMIAPPQELKTFSNEPINVKGMIQAPIASNGWRLEEAEFVVVRDGLKPLVGRDLFDALGISVTQTQNMKVVWSTLSHPNLHLKHVLQNNFLNLLRVLVAQKYTLLNLNSIEIFNQNIKRAEEYPLIYKNE